MQSNQDGGPVLAWKARLERGEFALQRCSSCAGYQFPPELLCRHCGAEDLALVAQNGAGEVYSTTTVRARTGDYNLCIVALPEGPRMMSKVVGGDAKIGSKVVAGVDLTSDLGPHVIFRLEVAEASR